MKQTQLFRSLLQYFNLEAQVVDFDEIHEAIVNDIEFKGANLWILLFATIVASVGLNVNSTAVIIGAMLISPLMGPINGMGYSLATYNFKLFRKALKNFTFSVIASLIASSAYFALSPLSAAHSELLARTSPTIYDVLIALFGGLAGIVAISSKQKGNVIPGVAIATALMPPLCTAGFGLATAQFNYFFGAFYLFTINAVFIALSSVVISYILKFPIRTVVEEEQKKKVIRWMAVIIILILIPSIYFGYNLVQKEHFVEQANHYVRNISIIEGNYLLKHEINPTTKTITLIYGGTALDESQKNTIKEKARDFSIQDAEIIIQKGLSFEVIDSRNAEAEKLKGEMNRLNLLLQEKEYQMDSTIARKFMGRQLLREIKSIYPQISTCSYTESYVFSDTIPDLFSLGVAVFSLKENTISVEDERKIANWLKTKLNKDTVRVYFERPVIAAPKANVRR